MGVTRLKAKIVPVKSERTLDVLTNLSIGVKICSGNLRGSLKYCLTKALNLIFG